MNLVAFAAAFVVLVVYLFLWWRNGPRAKTLIWDVIAPLVMGVLLRACGGLAGQAADALTTAATTAGGVIGGGTGLEGGAIPAGARVGLTPGGALVTLALLTCSLLALLAAAKRSGGGADAVRMVLLATAGVVLYSTAGGTSWGDASVIAAVNGLGGPITDWAYGRYA